MEIVNGKLTSMQMAEILNITPQRVTAIARERKVGGKMGRDLLFDPSDADKLKPRSKGGRPKKAASV